MSEQPESNLPKIFIHCLYTVSRDILKFMFINLYRRQTFIHMYIIRKNNGGKKKSLAEKNMQRTKLNHLKAHINSKLKSVNAFFTVLKTRTWLAVLHVQLVFRETSCFRPFIFGCHLALSVYP